MPKFRSNYCANVLKIHSMVAHTRPT